MELAIGAKAVFALMTLFTKDGSPKLIPTCSYPVTGVACVSHRERHALTELITQVGPGSRLNRSPGPCPNLPS